MAVGATLVSPLRIISPRSPPKPPMSAVSTGSSTSATRTETPFGHGEQQEEADRDEAQGCQHGALALSSRAGGVPELGVRDEFPRVSEHPDPRPASNEIYPCVLRINSSWRPMLAAMDATLRQLAAYTPSRGPRASPRPPRRLHVSQSSLSRAVADLERQLGVQLLERDTRNVQLTAAGAEALRIAEQIVTAHRAGHEGAAALPARRVGDGRRGDPALGRRGAAAAGDLRLPRPAPAGGGPDPRRARAVGAGPGPVRRRRLRDHHGRRTRRQQSRASRPLVRDRFVAVLPPRATRSRPATRSPGTSWPASRSWPSGRTPACAG